ncbi:MAG: DNA methyltransferase [Patescibacteria group bacterium]
MPSPALKSNYWFILGREPLLSAAELAAVFGWDSFSPVDGKPHPTSPWKGEGAGLSPLPRGNARGLPSSATKLAVLKLPLKNFNATEIIRRLGGTVKIGVEMGADLSENELIEKIVAELKSVSGKINFGLSFYGQSPVILNESASWRRSEESLSGRQLRQRSFATAQDDRNDLTTINLIEKWGKQIKKILKNENYSVRYVFKREPVLSSVTVDKNGLAERGREFLITSATSPSLPLERGGGQPFPLSKGEHKGVAVRYSLAKTLAVQPFEEFGARDFGRPGRDDLSGMLPPKLALMMINLAKIPLSWVILDPFCGSGTILTEALLLEYKNLIGTDISDKAMENTKKNIEWTLQNHKSQSRGLGTNHKLTLIESDIRNLSEKLKLNSVDAIITESYLGKPLRGRETEAELRQQAEELKKLYLISFEQFKKVLKKDGAVIFLVPRFRFKNSWITINLKPAVEKLGFKVEILLPGHEYLTYARPNQLVGREIWKFKI